MKKFLLLVFIFVFTGSLAQAEPKKEPKESTKGQKPVSFSSLLKPNVETMMTGAGAGDGKCPIIGIKRFFGVPILQYPATSEDPDCPPN